MPEVRAGRWGWGGGGCHSKVEALAASLPGCLSVASASLPPCTLSHFSPMSLPNQGGGDEKEREKEERKVNGEEEGEERMATFGLQQRSVNEIPENKNVQDTNGAEEWEQPQSSPGGSPDWKHTVYWICTKGLPD